MSTALAPLAAQSQAIDLPNKAYLLPQSVPMWPPVWWTWLIVAAIILLLLGLLFFWYRHHKKRTYRREALAEIAQKCSELNDKDCILLCHEMIRRCLISEGKIETAALPSRTLFELVDNTMPTTRRFSLLGNEFIDGPYQSQIELSQKQRTRMIKNTCYWIRKHHA
jgi:cbb3-type cytochrome oxidase subunit 3